MNRRWPAAITAFALATALWMSLLWAAAQENGEAEQPTFDPLDDSSLQMPASEPADGPSNQQADPELSLQIVSVATRPGVNVRMVVAAPSSAPQAVLLLFPGGNGAGHFSERDGRVRLGNNFLVRTTPTFADQGMLAAIVDSLPTSQTV